MGETVKNHSKRKHALLSASSSARWLACPRSAASEKQYPEETSEFAEEGTLAHEFAELYARGLTKPGRPMPTEQEVNDLANKFDPDRKFFCKEMTDAAQDYRDYIEEHLTDTATLLLEQRLDFSDWVPKGFGTGDAIILDNGVLTVIDFKYGRGVAVSAVDNSQMKLYALGAQHDYGEVYDTNTVRAIIFQPRIHNISEWEIPAAELLDWAENILKPTAELAFNGKGEYNAGPHCQFCEHAGACRQLATTCCKVVRMNNKRSKVENLAPWEIDEILRNSSMVTKWLNAVAEQAMKKLMAGEEIPGQKLVEGRSSRKWSSAADVMAVLELEGLETDKYMTAPELLSVTALEKSLGKKKAAELVGDLIVKEPGKIAIAPAEDKRPEYKPGGDFDDLDAEPGNIIPQ